MQKGMISPYLGKGWTILCVFLIGTMLAISCHIKMAMFVAMRFGITWEVNVKIIASVMRAVAGTVLLGWSIGDMFPRLQGDHRK
jgi:hypothetical protein